MNDSNLPLDDVDDVDGSEDLDDVDADDDDAVVDDTGLLAGEELIERATLLQGLAGKSLDGTPQP